MDQFRNRYAIHMSMVHPENVRFKYNILYECKFFHGSLNFKHNNCTCNSLKKAVTSQTDHIYSSRYNIIYNVEKLLRGIMDGNKKKDLLQLSEEKKNRKMMQLIILVSVFKVTHQKYTKFLN